MTDLPPIRFTGAYLYPPTLSTLIHVHLPILSLNISPVINSVPKCLPVTSINVYLRATVNPVTPKAFKCRHSIVRVYLFVYHSLHHLLFMCHGLTREGFAVPSGRFATIFIRSVLLAFIHSSLWSLSHRPASPSFLHLYRSRCPGSNTLLSSHVSPSTRVQGFSLITFFRSKKIPAFHRKLHRFSWAFKFPRCIIFSDHSIPAAKIRQHFPSL